MRNLQTNKIIIAGGGTGGHIYPALAIAQGLVELGIDQNQIIFFGSNRTMEKDIIPQAGYKLVTFTGRGLNRNEKLKNIINALSISCACMKATALFLKNRPKIVVGVGGYASVPALVAATFLKIPRVVHEQNSWAGRTNALAQKFGAKVATTFEKTQGLIDDPLLVGLPLLRDIETSIEQRIQYLQSKRDKKTVVLSGGSLGSKALNDAAVQMLKNHEGKIDFDFIHISGKKNFETLEAQYKSNGLENSVELSAYRSDISDVYAKSDCVVSRAGAGTCVELETLNINCVLIPLPGATHDHQRKNASGLVENQTCILLDQSELNGDSLFESIDKALSMAQKMPQNDFHLQASNRMASYVLELANIKL